MAGVRLVYMEGGEGRVSLGELAVPEESWKWES